MESIMYNFEIKEARTAITNRLTAGLMIKEHYTSLGSVGQASKIYSRDRYYYEPSDLIQTITERRFLYRSQL